MAKTTQVTINIPECGPLEKPHRIKAAEAVAALPAKDLERIAQIVQNPKALKALEKNWTFLKSMI